MALGSWAEDGVDLPAAGFVRAEGKRKPKLLLMPMSAARVEALKPETCPKRSFFLHECVIGPITITAKRPERLGGGQRSKEDGWATARKQQTSPQRAVRPELNPRLPLGNPNGEIHFLRQHQHACERGASCSQVGEQAQLSVGVDVLCAASHTSHPPAALHSCAVLLHPLCSLC